ncbi:unnamed protein product, partial [Anisakis simplex]
MEGGWWEGTFNLNTGWFPSDYVVVIPPSERFLRPRAGVADGTAPAAPLTNGDQAAQQIASFGADSSRQAYRQQIMKGFLESELEYVQSITKFYNNVMLKMKTSKLVSDENYQVLCGNLQLLVVHQSEVFEKMNESVQSNPNNAKIGGILLRAAPLLRQLLRFYCENHPKAVDLILRNRFLFYFSFSFRSEYERIAVELGYSLKNLISDLSRPFRHLETYASTLNELERSMSESH